MYKIFRMIGILLMTLGALAFFGALIYLWIMKKITVKQEKSIDAVLQIIGRWKSDKAVTPPLFLRRNLLSLMQN